MSMETVGRIAERLSEIKVPLHVLVAPEKKDKEKSSCKGKNSCKGKSSSKGKAKGKSKNY